MLSAGLFLGISVDDNMVDLWASSQNGARTGVRWCTGNVLGHSPFNRSTEAAGFLFISISSFVHILSSSVAAFPFSEESVASLFIW